MSIKPPKGNKGNRFTPTSENIGMPLFQHPIFCFKYLHKDYHLSDCEQEEKIDLVERLHALSQLTWQQIQATPKHGFGSEKISRSALRAHLPSYFTEGASILALRFSGKKPMVGVRDKFIFHIIFLDREFKLYNHS